LRSRSKGVVTSNAAEAREALAYPSLVVTSPPVAALYMAEVSLGTWTCRAVLFVLPGHRVVSRGAASQRAVRSKVLGFASLATS